MKKITLFTMLVLLGALGFTSAAQALTCDDITYTDALLATNPNVGESCLEVVDRGNASFVKLKARVVRQSVTSTIVQWQMPDGSWSESDRTYPPYGATAEIGGKEVRIADLAPKQEVNVYIVKENNWVVTEDVAAPAAVAAAPAPAPAPQAAPAPEPKPLALPTTATQVPLFALLGGLLILLGGAVSFVRTRL